MPKLRLLVVVEDPSDYQRCKVKMLTISFQSSSVELKIENKLGGQANTGGGHNAENQGESRQSCVPAASAAAVRR